MRRIFKSDDVVRIAEAVKIPDCIVRSNPKTIFGSTIIENNIPDEDLSDEERLKRSIYEEAQKYADDEISKLKTQMDESNEAYFSAEREKIIIEKEAVLKEAAENAERIIAEARAESEKIISETSSKADLIYDEAKIKGYNEGAAAKKEEIDQRLTDIGNVISEMKSDHEKFLDKYIDELRMLSLEIAEKLVCQKLEDDAKAIFPLIKSAIKPLCDVSWIKIELSDKLKETAAEIEEELSVSKSSQNIEVELRRDAPIGTCVVHTSEGVVVASVLTQIENIREYFKGYKENDGDEGFKS